MSAALRSWAALNDSFSATTKPSDTTAKMVRAMIDFQQNHSAGGAVL